MKMLKKAVALLLAVAFILTLSACHPKDEVAISCGDYEVTSAMYSYYLVMADSEAKSLIDSSDNYDTKAAGFKYTSQKIDGKSYTDYVEELALAKCKRYIVLEKLCDEAKVALDEDEKKDWISTAQYYWAYAYGSVLSLNGVSYNTYEKIFLNEALYNSYFDHLYLEGGEKEMSKADIQTNFDSHYSAVYLLTYDYSSEEKPDLDKIKKDMEKYKELFEDGKTFDEVKAQFDKDTAKESNTTSSSTTSSTASNSSNTSSTTSNTSSTTSTDSSSNSSTTDTSSTTSSEEKEEEKKPVDEDIVILTDNDKTSSGVAQTFTKYSDVAKLKDGEVAIIADSDNKKVYVVVKKDINADEYYLNKISDEVVYMVNGEGYDKLLEEAASKLDCKVSSFAIGQFKVSKIEDGSKQ